MLLHIFLKGSKQETRGPIFIKTGINIMTVEQAEFMEQYINGGL